MIAFLTLSELLLLKSQQADIIFFYRENAGKTQRAMKQQLLLSIEI